MMRRALLLTAVLLTVYSLKTQAADEAKSPAWKAAAGAVVITPDKPMWMAGYAARNKPSEGTAQELYAKTLILEDAHGTRLALVTLDLIGIPEGFREEVVAACRKAYDLPPESILLNASHTHCGPELRAFKIRHYGIDASRESQAIEYTRALVQKIVGLIGQSLKRLEPVELWYSHGRAGFAMNRRLPTDKGVINSPYPDGPVDQAVPVLKVLGPDKTLRAVLFGYACHNTTLSFYQFCGDYAGYAQEYLEEAHPNVTCLFMMGCGADQNPYPRSTLELAKQHGRALANAVETALEAKQPKAITGTLRTAIDAVELEFAPPPAKDELQKLGETGNQYQRRHAERLLRQLADQGEIQIRYAFPVQAARIGDDLLLVALPGETVVDYSLRLKQELAGPTVWVAGYSNHVFGYLPSQRVLKEGGYEAGGAMIYSAYPGPFAESVEDRVITKAHELARQVKLSRTSKTSSGR